MLYADVLLPLALPAPYTYIVPEELLEYIKERSRVIVQFGPKRFYTGIVVKLHRVTPRYEKIKAIHDLLDMEPLITDIQYKLLQWMARYYMCYEGEVLQAMLPSSLKITSESYVVLHHEWDKEFPDWLTDEARNLLTYLLEKRAADMKMVRQLLGNKKLVSTIKNLYLAGIITLQEELKKTVQPIYEKWVRLTPKYTSHEELDGLVAQLEKYPKQLEQVLFYLSLVPVWQQPELNEKGIWRGQLINKGFSDSAFNTLVKKGIFEEYRIKKSRFDIHVPPEKVHFELSDSQLTALNRILENFKNEKIVLFQGVTGSGKTEIYIKLIQEVIEAGGQALFLLPEIALTTQMVGRLKVIFGGKLGVYHSQASDGEKVEIWEQLRQGNLQVIVGVRSSVFLPFQQLSLIIIDEEHETSYKQADPAPRYHIRETAVALAKMHGARMLLGSATPSFESYYEAKNERWGLVQLMERFNSNPLPVIEVIDTRLEARKEAMKGEFSQIMLQRIEENANAGFQSIIFQNRRGYAPYLRCEDCGWVPVCEHCDVSLTFHQYVNKVICHICGTRKQTPTTCPECGSVKIKTVGFGTEKIEESLGLLLPKLNVARMDQDTTRSKGNLRRIIADVESQKVDILVGTQMVSKGFDFERMQLVGILDVDRMLHIPNFRAVERAFQLVLQVAGRAGRRDAAGQVWIQSAAPYQPFLKWVQQYDYEAFYQNEIDERRKYGYPPFTRLVRIIFRHKQEHMAKHGAEKYYQLIVTQLGKDQIMGPGVPSIGRVKGYYIFDLWIKLNRETLNIPKIKAFLLQRMETFRSLPEFKKVDIYADVDPV
jgi:primosomal protein N' (replication factor Y)